MGAKTPNLSYFEMQSVLSRSLEIYQRGYFGRLPKKITVHKNTEFKEEEILGALNSFRDGTELELVQIVKGVGWKGIRFNMRQPPQCHSYPVDRGTYIPIETNEALLWTQGSVRHVHLRNPASDIYKEGALKPTPSDNAGPAEGFEAPGVRLDMSLDTSRLEYAPPCRRCPNAGEGHRTNRRYLALPRLIAGPIEGIIRAIVRLTGNG